MSDYKSKLSALRRSWLQRGVTLVELMIVVVLVGALAGIAAPSVMRSMDRMAARSAARDIANSFRMARNHAMSRKVAIVAVIDQTAGDQRIQFYQSAERHCLSLDVSDLEDDFTLLHSLEFSRDHPRVYIWGHSPVTVGTEASPVCITPSGRFVHLSGLPIANGLDDCERYDFLVGIARIDWDKTGGLEDCPSDSTEAARQTKKDQRDSQNLYLIHLGYNGHVEVVQ